MMFILRYPANPHGIYIGSEKLKIELSSQKNLIIEIDDIIGDDNIQRFSYLFLPYLTRKGV